MLGWRWAFAVAGISSLAGFLLVAFAVPGGKKSSCEPSLRIRVSIVRVAREKEAMAYILGYAAHMWELFGMRSWIVAFLAFSANLQGVATPVLSPTRVAALINLVGLPASIGGNELCRRFGRKRTIARIMVGSSLLSVAVGLSAPLPYNLVVCLGFLYGVFVVADSASLTAGAVINSPAGGRGATLAVHSTLGFGAAFLGPLAVGIVLDLLRNNPSAAWAAAFATMGAGCALGPVALFGLKKTKL